jgi:hypothetical protein
MTSETNKVQSELTEIEKTNQMSFERMDIQDLSVGNLNQACLSP